MFCAAYSGENDARFLRDYGMTNVSCMDIDNAKLGKMRPNYPKTWGFARGDAFAFLDRLEPVPTWGVVTCDPYSGDMDARLRERVPKLLAITQRVLVYGVGNAARDEAMAAFRAEGFEPRIVERTALASWLVVEKEPE